MEEEEGLKTLSSRERLLRVFRRQPLDRMPIRLWGVDPISPSSRPSYHVLDDLVEQHELDLIRSWGPNSDERDPPAFESHSERREGDQPDRYDQVHVTETPDGPLTAIYTAFNDGRPGYVKKHSIESIDEARKWMSIPSPEPQFGTDSYWELEKKTGDRAMLMVSLGHAMYGVQRHMGSETFGFWLMEERELLHEMIDKSFRAIEAAVKRHLAHGVGDCFGWVGPELCAPPLASPRDFRDFVLDYDKRIIDLIHDAGKLVWVHCHGDMDPVLEMFVEMGVDCLNPIEPPPMGNLTLAEAKERIGGKMSLEGGVQNGDFDLLSTEEMAKVVENAVLQGKPGGGYILCPTSSPTTWPVLNELHIENYRTFVETGLRLATYENGS
jgi:hypothetical protein